MTIRSGIEVVVSLRGWSRWRRPIPSCRWSSTTSPSTTSRRPPGDDVRRFVEVATRNHGRKVLAHRKAGRGRSGTMAALYLKSRGMDGAEAARGAVLRPGAIETPEQEALVLDFEFRTGPAGAPRRRAGAAPGGAAPCRWSRRSSCATAGFCWPVAATATTRAGAGVLGGKLHLGEAPAASLARELAEELAATVAVDELLTFVYWEYPEKRVLLLFYRCRITAGEPRARSAPRWTISRWRN